jgi:hypothetical protein
MQARGVRRPSLSSVSTARFVTTGAIDLKLCTYVPQAKSNSQTKFRSSPVYKRHTCSSRKINFGVNLYTFLEIRVFQGVFTITYLEPLKVFSQSMVFQKTFNGFSFRVS